MKKMKLPSIQTYLRSFIVALLFLAGCGGGSGSSNDDPLPEAQWTIMVFMAGDSDISEAAFYNINDMEDIGSTSDVNIVVQVEFSPEFSPSLPGNTLRGRIVQDHNNNKIGSTLNDLGNLDMTDPATLSDFISWASAQYPAKRYAIVLWSHGLGWKGFSKGIMEDYSTAGNSHIMPIKDLANAMQDSGVKFDLIDFDACLMGMYEVAYELKGLSDYITFSEALFPAYGNPYIPILSELTARPDMDGEELAHTVLSACKDSFKNLGLNFTKSAIRLSGIEMVHMGVNDLADSLINAMGSDRKNILTAVENTQQYYSYIYRDLGDFLNQLKAQTTNRQILDSVASLENTLGDLVIENQFYSSTVDDPIERSHGLSIYLPVHGLKISQDLLKYSTLSSNQGDSVTWADFVTRLSAD